MGPIGQGIGLVATLGITAGSGVAAYKVVHRATDGVREDGEPRTGVVLGGIAAAVLGASVASIAIAGKTGLNPALPLTYAATAAGGIATGATIGGGGASALGVWRKLTADECATINV